MVTLLRDWTLANHDTKLGLIWPAKLNPLRNSSNMRFQFRFKWKQGDDGPCIAIHASG